MQTHTPDDLTKAINHRNVLVFIVVNGISCVTQEKIKTYNYEKREEEGM